MNGAGLEAIDDFEKLSERASQTVEPGDAQAVARSSVLDELGKTGAVRALSGGDVGEETDGACLEQAVSGLNPTKVRKVPQAFSYPFGALFFSAGWQFPILRDDPTGSFGGQRTGVVLQLLAGEVILPEQIEMPP